MDKFILTPAYCLYAGVAILEQNGSKIKFMTETDDDIFLRAQLRKAFYKHVEFVRTQENANFMYNDFPVVEFVTGSYEKIYELVMAKSTEKKSKRKRQNRLYFSNRKKHQNAVRNF